MIDKDFEDEPSVYPENLIVDEDIKGCLHEDVMICFPNATTVEEDYTKYEESGQRVKDVGSDEKGLDYRDSKLEEKMG